MSASPRRLVVNIGEVIIDAEPGADLVALEAEVRAGIAASFLAGIPPAFARSETVLEAAHAGVRGIGTAITAATPPRSRP